MPNVGRVMSPKQVVQQWVHVPHRFEVELWNFEVRVAREAVAIFKKSFEMHRLNSDGSPLWAERKRNYRHPILHETGTLQNSIRWRNLEEGDSKTRGVQIYTDPSRFGTAKRHKGFCYAAVHNSADNKFRTGHMRNMPQRQFIGHSTVLDDKIKEYSMMLFAHLP